MTIRIQSLVLHYLKYHVSQFERVMNSLSHRITETHTRKLSPRDVPLNRAMLALDMTMWQNLCEISHANIDLLSTTTDILSEPVKDKLTNPRAFCMLQTEIRMYCARQESLELYLAQEFESRLELLESFRGLDDSSRVLLLTLFASIFIAVSLTAAILSMQTRFADFHFLGYDVLGVATIISIIAAALSMLLWMWNFVNDRYVKKGARKQF